MLEEKVFCGWKMGRKTVIFFRAGSSTGIVGTPILEERVIGDVAILQKMCPE